MEIKFNSNETTKLKDYSGYFIVSKNNIIYSKPQDLSKPSDFGHENVKEEGVSVYVMTDEGIGIYRMDPNEDITPISVDEIKVTAMRGYNGKFSKAPKNRVI